MANSPLKDIETLRAEIDAIDKQVTDLLVRRFSAVREIGARKAAAGLLVSQPSRETAVLMQRRDAVPSELQQSILNVYIAILEASRRLQESL